jgi:hypothetical protein
MTMIHHITQLLFGAFLMLSLTSTIATASDSAILEALDDAQSPQAYILKKFQTHDVILLAEDHAILQNLEFVKSLIPSLYEAGVYTIGMEFGASERQKELDVLTTADHYDADLARDMMYFYNVGWAYSEYIHLPKAVWEFNQSLPAGSRPFRILNLSYQFDWSHWNETDPESAMDKIFHKGDCDLYRAAKIKSEIIQKGEKILALVGTIHAITHYKAPVLCEDGKRVGTIPNLLGNALYEEFPDKVYSVLLHQPVGNRRGRLPYLLSPAGGALERALEKLDYRPVGLDLTDSPVGKLPEPGSPGEGYEDFSLSDYVQGYIFLVPLSKMTGCTYEAEFFDGKDWNDILDQYPTRQWSAPPDSLEAYQAQVRAYVDVSNRYQALHH